MQVRPVHKILAQDCRKQKHAFFVHIQCNKQVVMQRLLHLTGRPMHI